MTALQDKVMGNGALRGYEASFSEQAKRSKQEREEFAKKSEEERKRSGIRQSRKLSNSKRSSDGQRRHES
jgi:hypothetical protein